MNRRHLNAHLPLGTVVIALFPIIESSLHRDPTAEPYDPGWVHAEPLDAGVVIFVADNGTVDVEFPRTGTNSTCLVDELWPVIAQA